MNTLVCQEAGHMEENLTQIKQDTMMFFDRHREAIPIYESFENMLFHLYPQTKMKVQKTQITFSNRHVFACVSFMRPKKKAELPASYFVLTLGLSYPLESERAAVKTEPYPGRWTTHIVISDISDLNQELFDWIKQAYEFAEYK